MSAVFMVADNRIGFAPLSTANMRGIGWFRVGRRFAPPVFRCKHCPAPPLATPEAAIIPISC
jgi:hypothetical protein